MGDVSYTLDDTNKVLTVNDTACTATPDANSMFRFWILEDGVAKSGYVVEDIVFTAKFVKSEVEVKFEQDKTSPCVQENVPVTFTPVKDTQKIHMDAIFNPKVDRDSTTQATATFKYTGISDVTKVIEIVKDEDGWTKYKFADDLVFSNPASEGMINEVLFETIENEPYVIKYRIVERVHVDIKANLDGGEFVGYTLKPISTDIGGQEPDGEWTQDTDGVWCNTVYEEYDVTTLKNATINEPNLT